MTKAVAIVTTLLTLSGVGLLVWSSSQPVPPSSEKPKRPNVVIFFADDIGWGDFGANWAPNKEVTPNLNNMAERGMRLTDFHAGASVCAPSRAALLTGRLGLRTGLVRNFSPGSVGGLPVNETTLAEVLQTNGYHTGMIGKWHLGITAPYHPNSRGFDYYYGLPYSNDMGCVDVHVYDRPHIRPCREHNASNFECPTRGAHSELNADYSTALPLYEDREIVEQPADLNQLGDHYAEKAVNFISTAAKEERPFFLYVAFAHMHCPLSFAPRFANSTSQHTIYSDTLHEMDDVIGRINQALKKNGLDDNTMVWFTGDNGPWLIKCQYGGNSGPFLGKWLTKTFGGGSTAKSTTWEAGHREPTVVVWPGHVAPNTTSGAITSAMDIFPTVLKAAGIEMPGQRKYDGIPLQDLLEGRSEKAHDVLFHPNSGCTGRNGEIDTVRFGPYKAFWKSGGLGGNAASCDGKRAKPMVYDPPILFNVDKDPAESTLVTRKTDPDYAQVIKTVRQLRANLLADIKADNTSKPDYSKAGWACPCCDPSKFLCRCKRDGSPLDYNGLI